MNFAHQPSLAHQHEFDSVFIKEIENHHRILVSIIGLERSVYKKSIQLDLEEIYDSNNPFEFSLQRETASLSLQLGEILYLSEIDSLF